MYPSSGPASPGSHAKKASSGAGGGMILARGGLRAFLFLLIVVSALVLVLSADIMRHWGHDFPMGRSLLDSVDLISGHWFSTFINREQILIGIIGCELHEQTERLLSSWPPDAGVDAACLISEEALSDDVNATLVADRYDVRVVAVHDAAWTAKWGSALKLFVEEGYEHVYIVQSDTLLPPHSISTLREALRNNPGVDIMLPAVATSHELGSADGVRQPSSAGAQAYPQWISAGLGGE